jgi:hypothetical protein
MSLFNLSSRKILVFALCGVILLLFGCLVIPLIKPPPNEVDLNISPALEIKEALIQMYLVEDTIQCIPTTDIDTLSTILVDTSDYVPTFQELKAIVQIFGTEGLTHAGFLTTKQAYYLMRKHPIQVTPPPGMIPTLPPAVRCAGPSLRSAIFLKTIALETSDKAIAGYSYLNGDYEAILRKINAQWMVTGIKLIHWYGNG